MERQITESDLHKRLKAHQEAIEQNLNVSCLIPHLYQNGIISDLGSGIADNSRPSLDRIKELVSLVTENDAMVNKKFLEALENEDQHLGHRYIRCLLMDQKYADEEDISTSSKIQVRVRKNMRRVIKGMKLERALIDHLYQKNLLTRNEFEELSESGNKGSNDKNLTVLRLLHSKGPTAHLLFAQCLKEETEHSTHRELYQLISGECIAGENQQRVSVTSRKRKLEDCERHVSVKRNPSRLAIEGGLKTVKYFEVMKKIRQYHNQGEWKAVEDIVQQSANRSVELHVAVLLESCTGLIIRKQRDRVIQVVAKARELCSKIDNNCATYLRGRCEYTMARMHQYANERDKALKYITMARNIQYNVEFGEDTALTNYCYGCILLECLACSSKSCTNDEIKESAESLESAIMPYNKSRIYGLNVAHPKIRLAQLHLGSSSCCPGTTTDSKRLGKAQYYLERAAEPSVDSLAPRTQSIYYYTQSDLYRNKGELEEARRYAQKALAIAEANKFTTEIESANARLSQMVHT